MTDHVLEIARRLDPCVFHMNLHDTAKWVCCLRREATRTRGSRRDMGARKTYQE